MPKSAGPLLRALAIISLTSAGPLPAQVETARITGTVKDSSGAVIPGAKITITHVATNAGSVALANAVGHYLSVPLQIGEYRITAESTGFKRAVRSGIQLEIQQTAVIDFKLDVGDIAETVEVTADAGLLQATDASLGQVIDNKKIVDLPLNGRDYLQLAALSSGATPVVGPRSSTGFSADGLRTNLNNYMLDGLDNNMHQHAYTGGQAQTLKPSIDAIHEFKVQTNAYSAEFGNNMGAVVNVTLKSGANAFHGNLYEFLRNETFDARNFFDNPEEPTPPYKQHQFGGTLGGRMARDKTFFFLDYEGNRQRVSRTVISTVATARERRGDFSQYSLRGEPVRIFDPATFDRTTRSRLEFPNNIIPPARLDPVGTKATELYPLPNSAGINNYRYNPLDRLEEDKFNLRLDHRFNANDTIFGRVSYQIPRSLGGFNLPPPAFGGSGAGTGVGSGGGNAYERENHARSVAFSYIHILSPSMFNHLKLGYNQLLTELAAPTREHLNRGIGLQGLPFDLEGLAVFNLSNYQGLGTMTGNPNRTDSQVRQLKDDVSWTRGRHTVKTGLSLTFLQAPQVHYYYANGVFDFNGNFTRQPVTSRFGSDLADLLLGIPFRSQLSGRAQSALRRRLDHGYVQDEYQVSSSLALSFGLRYEYNGPWFDRYNHLANLDFDTDRERPRLVVAKPGGIVDRSTLQPDYINFAPRIGVARRLGQRTAIRTAYGIYYGGVDHVGDRYLYANPPFFFQSVLSTDSISPSLLLRDGFPAGATTYRVTNMQVISQERMNTTAYSQQWNFTIQREVLGNLSVEVAYAGAKGNHLLRRLDANAPPPGPGDINARRPVTSLAVPGLDSPVSPLADAYRREWTANSIYHGLQMKAERRFSGGLSFLGAYMWSKAIDDLGPAGGQGAPQDPHNLRAERALSDNHIPHRLVFSYNYDLPLSKGKRSMGAGRVVQAVVGGWSVGGITTLSSGRRFNLSVKGNPSNTGGPDRPDRLRDPRLPKSSRTLERWFDTEAFRANAPFRFGNAPRNAVEGPGIVNFDFALYKSFRLAENLTSQFRAELFNLANTPQFENPGGQLGSRDFGVITSAGPPRIIQFGIKTRW